MRKITRLRYELERLLPQLRQQEGVIVIAWDRDAAQFVVPMITFLDDKLQERTEPETRHNDPDSAIAALYKFLDAQGIYDDVTIIVNDTEYLQRRKRDNEAQGGE